VRVAAEDNYARASYEIMGDIDVEFFSAMMCPLPQDTLFELAICLAVQVC
jgi:hypothetical protein